MRKLLFIIITFLMTTTAIADDWGFLHADFAGIYNHDTSDATTLYLVDVFHHLDTFTADMPESISDGDHTIDAITIGATGTYYVSYTLDIAVGTANKQYRINCYEEPTTNSGGTITGITEATPGVVTTTSAHGLSTGDNVEFEDIVGMVELNSRVYHVGTTTSDTFQILDQENVNVNTGVGHTSWSSNGVVYKVIELEGLSTTFDYGVQDDFKTIPASGFVNLREGCKIEVYIRGLTDTTTPTMTSGQLSIMRVK